MDKRENVINGLKCRIGLLSNHNCGDCKYGWLNGKCEWECSPLSIAEDALAILEAQEPVEPKVDVDEWLCGNCGHKLEHQELLGENVLFHEQYSYCPQCGKAVKWDG